MGKKRSRSETERVFRKKLSHEVTIIFFDNNNVAEPAETTTSKIRSANFESSTKNIAKFQRNVFWKNREACGASF